MNDPKYNSENCITLKEYFEKMMDWHVAHNEQRFQEVANKAALALEATREAINKSDVANEKRFSAVNEFRETLSDQQTHFVTKSEIDLRMQALDDKITVNTKMLDLSTGRVEGIKYVWFAIAGFLSFVSGVIMLVLAYGQYAKTK